MSIILGIICIIIVYMLVHLGVMYLHAKYKLFKDEEICVALHVAFMITGVLMFSTLILFLSTL